MKSITGTLFVFLLTAGIVMSQNTVSSVQEAADVFVSAYNSQNYDEISNRLDPIAAKQLTPAVLKQVLDAHRLQYGKLTSLGKPKVENALKSVYPALFERGEFRFTIVVTSQKRIGGFRLAPVAPKNFLVNSTILKLPFEGDWFVFWGGDSVADNYHQDHPNQRFAYDFLKVDGDGKSHRGEGTTNEDYYAFGEKITAPADGVVTDVVDGVRDNIPGAMNPMMALGNNLVIKHADGEYSVYAHFKQNSITVKVGQKVRTGDLLGLCGNSGNSSEAHLHFQIQKGAFFENEGSKKTFFTELLVGPYGSRAIQTRYSPKKGDLIMNDYKPNPADLVPKN